VAVTRPTLRLVTGLTVAVATTLATPDAQAIDVPEVGGETLSIDISNTSQFAYRFNNRNSTSLGTGNLAPEQFVDDNYSEWLNQLYVRSYYWKVSFGMRLDSAVWGNQLTRQEAQSFIVDELGGPDVSMEERFSRELHSRFNNFIYPAKLWVGFKHKRFEATVGDFYAHLGRGLVFSVRKLDELGIDTTVRGIKVKYGHKFDSGFRMEASAFGGQLNPIRLDFPTGRVMAGSGSPIFFGFPKAGDISFFRSTGQPPPNEFVEVTERGKPSYLEDSVVGGTVSMGPKQVQVEGNVAVLFRQDNSREQLDCIQNQARPVDQCRAEFPDFTGVQEESRSRNQIRNFGGAVTIPTVDGIFEGYVEGMGQNAAQGRVTAVDGNGAVTDQLDDTWGYAIYANTNFTFGSVSATLEGKHYHNYLQLGANTDNSDLAFGGREFNIVQFTRPPTAESIFTNFIGAPTVCSTGGRGRLDASLNKELRVYGWLGYFVEHAIASTQLEADDLEDPNSPLTCTPNGNAPTPKADLLGIDETATRSELRRTDTWDMAAGADIDLQKGKTHYWAWIGARYIDNFVPRLDVNRGPGCLATATDPNECFSKTFYRENYIRYDFNQHLTGPFSVSALGWHRRAFEPDQLPNPWNEGENLLALNWAPHLSFIFGNEYQTRPGLPTLYFNGAIQYRSKDSDTWYGMLLDQVRVFVGQRRSALRCVGGVCRVFPAFEGGLFELVSRF
jgi:hypothetical protein